MSSFLDLPISRKFAYAFGAVCFVCAILGGLSLSGFLKVNAAVNDIVNNSTPSMKVLGDIRFSFSSVRRTEALMLLCDTPECNTYFTTKRLKVIADYKAQVQKYEPLIGDAHERALYDAFRQNAAVYFPIGDRAAQAFMTGDRAEAQRLLVSKEASKSYNATADNIQADIDLNNQAGNRAGANAMSLAHRMILATCVLMAITLLLCGVIGMVLTRAVVPPLVAATGALERVAEKDLTASVEVRSRDDIGRLSAALNKTVESMRGVLTAVAKSADTLSAATEELSVRTEQSSGNTKTQAAKTNQIAAAAAEMTATISEISQNAEHAAAASRDSVNTADQGGEVMQTAATSIARIADASEKVAEKMSSLADRSNEIGKVVSVIQEISGQTNLLALNAAIEAARAGEQGRGFAVVAGEVRRLAERTTTATEEIAATITSIQEETRATLSLVSTSRDAVDSGLSETEKARQNLQAIIDSSRSVEHQIQMIATAATQQSAASHEISESAQDISHLATENSQASEEGAEACRNLAVLANELDGMVRQFRLHPAR